MSDTRISNLARALGDEGEHLVAASLYFVSSLRDVSDRAGLAILAEFARRLSARNLGSVDRELEEIKAIAELVRQL